MKLRSAQAATPARSRSPGCPGCARSTQTISCATFPKPPEKLSLGVPLYGRHWFTRYDATSPDRANVGHQAVGWMWGSHLAERQGATLTWDAEQGTTWGHFAVGGTWEWVFLEDARAFQAKVALQAERRLRRRLGLGARPGGPAHLGRAAGAPLTRR